MSHAVRSFDPILVNSFFFMLLVFDILDYVLLLAAADLNSFFVDEADKVLSTTYVFVLSIFEPQINSDDDRDTPPPGGAK